MRLFRRSPRFVRSLVASIPAVLLAGWAAQATPLLVIDAKTGDVLIERDATEPWYPASLTKLVTVYTALTAVREGRITLDTPLLVSRRAASMPPSKMGFRPGTEVTLDNALKMLMVKSANDLAITIAEGVGGSVESFADQMNKVAAKIGMRESHFVNPNGLHADGHYSSARDMAVVGMALYRDFPEHSDLYGIGAFRLGSMIVPTHNGLMGRYPGAEGMKTGFTCPAGLNVVASATRGGRRLIAVVLGYPSAKERTIEAAKILDAGFATGSTGRKVTDLPTVAGGPPNMRDQVCGPHRKEITEDDFAVRVAGVPAGPAKGADEGNPLAFFRAPEAASAASPIASDGVAATQAAMATRPVFEPIDVYVGPAPGWTGGVAGPVGVTQQSAAADADEDDAKAAAAKPGKKGKRGKIAKAAPAKPAPKAVEAKKTEPKKVAAHALAKGKKTREN